VFAGIIETTATLEEIRTHGTNRTLILSSPISDELTADQSVAHNGVCLTVEENGSGGRHRVTAIEETLQKTMLGELNVGERVNLERSLRANGRVDGHFVQGHVDTCGRVEEIVDRNGSRDYRISFPAQFERLIVPQGSICVNGISLTVASSDPEHHLLSVSIIPYTMELTNLGDLEAGARVNLEFDILGKYILKNLEQSGRI